MPPAARPLVALLTLGCLGLSAACRPTIEISGYAAEASRDRRAPTDGVLELVADSVSLPDSLGRWDTPVDVTAVPGLACTALITDAVVGEVYRFDARGRFQGVAFRPPRSRVGRMWIGPASPLGEGALVVPDWAGGELLFTERSGAVRRQIQVRNPSDSLSPAHEIAVSASGQIADHWFSTVIPTWSGNWGQKDLPPVLVIDSTGAVRGGFGSMQAAPGAYLTSGLSRGQITWTGDTLWYGRYADGVVQGFVAPTAHEGQGPWRQRNPVVEVRPPLRFAPTTPREVPAEGVRRSAALFTSQATSFTAGAGLVVVAGPLTGDPPAGDATSSELYLFDRTTDSAATLLVPGTVRSVAVIHGHLWVITALPAPASRRVVLRYLIPEAMRHTPAC